MDPDNQLDTQTNATDGGELQQDPAHEGAAQQERQLSPRELAMNSIKVVREEEPPAAPALQLEPAAQQQGAQQQADVDQVALQSAGPQVLAQDLDKVMVKIKIDGQEREVSVADMQRQYQINGAAEVRLQQATRLLNEARAQAAAPPVGNDPAKPNGESPTAPEKQLSAKEIVAALFEGDEEKATQLVEQMLAGRPQPGPTQDPQAMIEQLAPAIKQQFVVESALDKFMAANADIVQDPHLVDLTNRFLEAEVAGGKPYPEALEAAGQQTRGWLAKMGVQQTPEPPPTTPRDKKLERKAGMDNLPILNKTASSVQEAPQTATSVIAEMRKARGLPD